MTRVAASAMTIEPMHSFHQLLSSVSFLGDQRPKFSLARLELLFLARD